MSIYSTAYDGAGKRQASEVTPFNTIDEVTALMGTVYLAASSRWVIYGVLDGDRVMYSDFVVTLEADNNE